MLMLFLLLLLLSPPPLIGYIYYDTVIRSDGLTVSLVDSLFDVDASSVEQIANIYI